MPYGKGTYGSKRGRPTVKKSGNTLTKRQKTLPKTLQAKIKKTKTRMA